MNHYQRQMIKEAYEAGYNSINEQKKEVPDNIKTIAGELDKAVKAHTSQAKRLRAAGYDTDEDLPKEVRDIPKELDAAVKMHKSQAERLRKAGLSEAFEAGYRSGLNEQEGPTQPPGNPSWPGLLFYLTQVAFGDTTPIALQSVDYNNNGVVDFQDLLRLLNLWSNGYPPQTAQEYIDNTYSVNDREPEPFDVKKISKIISKAPKKNLPSSKLSRRK